MQAGAATAQHYTQSVTKTRGDNLPGLPHCNFLARYSWAGPNRVGNKPAGKCPDPLQMLPSLALR